MTNSKNTLPKTQKNPAKVNESKTTDRVHSKKIAGKVGVHKPMIAEDKMQTKVVNNGLNDANMSRKQSSLEVEMESELAKIHKAIEDEAKLSKKEALSEGDKKALIMKRKEHMKTMRKYAKNINKINRIRRSGTADLKNSYGNILEVKSLKKFFAFGDYIQEVLKGVNLQIKEGEFAVILGPSGSGKTTLLNIISGLDRPTFGDIVINNQNLPCMGDKDLTKFRRDNIGFVFQQYNLLPNLTVLENAEVGAHLQKNREKRIDIQELYQMMNMSHELDKFPHQISGGEQQRVSIARAVSKNPAILFADEPTGAIDEEMSKKILQFLVDINKRYNTTIVIVTHNPNIAEIANHVIRIGNGVIREQKFVKNPKSPADIHWS